MLPDRTDKSWHGLPAWATEFRPQQVEAVEQILEHCAAGVKVVLLDAPTGTGKTLIAEMVRAQLQVHGLYVCSTKTLQDQFARDFSAAVLKGRRNYPTELGGDGVTADDCTGKTCVWCTDTASCPYQIAKDGFTTSPIGCTNTAYLLGQVNNTRPDRAVTFGRGLVTVDECDELEGVLVGQAGLNVSPWTMRQFGLPALKKGAHVPTIVRWLDDASHVVGDWAKLHAKQYGRDVDGLRKVRRALRLSDEMKFVAQDMEDEPDEWVRDYSDRDADDRRVILKPVRVGRYAQDKMWRHGERWLCMSATILNPQQWAEDVGLDDGDWAYVTVQMGFHVDNRPIVMAGLADMGRNGEGTWEQRCRKIASGIETVLDTHGNANTLVHTVSYRLAREITAALTRRTVNGQGAWTGKMQTEAGRIPVHTYLSSDGRDEAVDRFTRDGGVLIASSLERGVDLVGDLCRVVIVAKVPFPNMGDRRTSARMRLQGGRSWYATQTARSIVQMTGRGVRSHEDWATTYVFDTQFSKFWRQWKQLLPKWWRDAVEVQRPQDFI